MGLGEIVGFNLFAMERFRWVQGATPFSSAWWPFLGSIGYLLLIYSLRRLKKKEGVTFLFGHGIDFSQKTDTKRWLALHNTFVVALSATIFIGTVVGLLQNLTRGVTSYDLFCDPNRLLVRSALSFWSYVFYLSKYYEMLDTVFLVLAKRPVEFQHVFQHMLTVWLAWASLCSETSHQSVPLLLNTFVHMLTYYFNLRTSQGYVLHWKRRLTQLQVLQLGVNLAALGLWLPMHLSEPHGCSGQIWAWLLCIVGNVSFYVTLQRFSSKSHKEKKGI